MLLNRQRSSRVLDASPRSDESRQLVLHPTCLMLAPPEEKVPGDSVSVDPASRAAPECTRAPSRQRIKALGRLSPESPEFLGVAHFHLNFPPVPHKEPHVLSQEGTLPLTSPRGTSRGRRAPLT